MWTRRTVGFRPSPRKGERETKRGRGVEPIRGRTGACTTGVSFAKAYRGYPAGYNNNFQIVQSPGYVAILLEQIHETRIVPLDRRQHLEPTVQQLLGDSRGWWEGETLVVETTNLTDQTHLNYNSGFHSDAMHIVERFTRVAPDRINYEFTVTDPRTWTSSWTAAFPWNATEGGELFEYACHEGNYSMTNMLSGARAEEHAAEGLTQKTQPR